MWAAPIVFALAFGESLAFISLLIPAWAALVGIGVLIGSRRLNFWPIWVAGSIGAALGDWLSYWVGVKLGPPVAHVWPLSRHPDLIPKGEAFVKHWGVLGDLHRPLLRAAARLGAAGRRHLSMPYWRFSIAEFHLGLRVGGRAAHPWATWWRSMHCCLPALGIGSVRVYANPNVRDAIPHSRSWRISAPTMLE